ncbi:MAG: hypothetical protein V2A79_05820 [Planctomycetota bacterium]
MRLALQRVKVYSRLTLIVLVILAVGAVLWKNRDHQAQVWFFWLVDTSRPINVLWLILCTALGALVAYWTLSLVWGVRRDMKKVALESALREREEGQEARAKELQEQEQRIDAKLKKAISEE